MESKSPNRWLVSCVAILLVFVGYLASYPIAVKIYIQHDPISGLISVDGNKISPYKPIDWLIDNAPLESLLIAWTETWGVREEMERSMRYRQGLSYYGIEIRNPLPRTIIFFEFIAVG